MQPSKQKRRIKLIKPRLQIKLTLIFMGFSALSLLMQYLLLTSSLTSAALRLPTDSALMLREISAVLLSSIGIAFALFMPLIFLVGVMTTFRFAGPLHRLEMFMRATINGENPRDCKLRGEDEPELHGFCELLNEVTAPLREEGSNTVTEELDPTAVPESLPHCSENPLEQTRRAS
ncbi:MAG: hypothetical protein ACI835_003315 [Planctomycetota bacterium]|jgi:hypothetical protein